MRKKFFVTWLWGVNAAVLGFLFAGSAFAAHPLITDDTGTQGKGRFQVEVNGEQTHDRDRKIKTTTTQLASTLTYGITEPLDLVLTLPYQHLKTDGAEGETIKTNGISDLTLDLKWRFHEKDGLSFALKPGITIPTGDDTKGLGAERATYRLFFIGTKEAKPWTFHVNLGYIRNQNSHNARENLLHASLATAAEIENGLKIVVNIGIESDADRSSHNHPAFVLAGLIYALSESFEIDCGIKGGITKPESDYSVLAGITYRY